MDIDKPDRPRRSARNRRDFESSALSNIYMTYSSIHIMESINGKGLAPEGLISKFEVTRLLKQGMFPNEQH